MLDRRSDEQVMLIKIDRGGFAGGPHYHDSVAALLDVPIHQLAESFQVETAVLVHRRDDSDQTTLQDSHRLIRLFREISFYRNGRAQTRACACTMNAQSAALTKSCRWH